MIQPGHNRDDHQSNKVRPCKLTNAVVPRKKTRLLEGYRHIRPIEEASGIIVAISRERLLQVFLNMIEHVGDEADFLMMVPDRDISCKTVWWRRSIETIFLMDGLDRHWDFIRDDGSSEIIIQPTEGTDPEIILTPQKVIHVHSVNINPFIAIAKAEGIRKKGRLKTIEDTPHIVRRHPNQDEYIQELARALHLQYEIEDDSDEEDIPLE